jgi:hypothetical protein
MVSSFGDIVLRMAELPKRDLPGQSPFDRLLDFNRVAGDRQQALYNYLFRFINRDIMPPALRTATTT